MEISLPPAMFMGSEFAVIIQQENTRCSGIINIEKLALGRAGAPVGYAALAY